MIRKYRETTARSKTATLLCIFGEHFEDLIDYLAEHCEDSSGSRFKAGGSDD